MDLELKTNIAFWLSIVTPLFIIAGNAWRIYQDKKQYKKLITFKVLTTKKKVGKELFESFRIYITNSSRSTINIIGLRVYYYFEDHAIPLMPSPIVLNGDLKVKLDHTDVHIQELQYEGIWNPEIDMKKQHVSFSVEDSLGNIHKSEKLLIGNLKFKM